MKKTFLDINDKFNTIVIKYDYLCDIDKSRITKRALLSDIICKANMNYPSLESVLSKLDSFYGAYLFVDYGRYSYDKMYLEIGIEFICPKIINDKSYTFYEVISFFNDFIKNPYIINNKFSPSIFNQSKMKLKNELLDYDNNYSTKLNRILKDIIFINDIDKLKYKGYIGDLNLIKNEDIYYEFINMINNDDLIISVIGNISLDDKNYIDIYNDNIKLNYYCLDINKDYRSIKIKENYKSSYLSIAYKLDGLYYQNDEYFQSLVLSSILGEESYSLLFQNVREKLGLCYSIYSSFDSKFGLLIINASLLKRDYDRLKKEIENCIEIIKKGLFSEELIRQAKNYLIDIYYSELDNENDNKLKEDKYKYLFNIDTKKLNFIDHINKVSKDDIIKLINKSILIGEVFIEGDNSDF